MIPSMDNVTELLLFGAVFGIVLSIWLMGIVIYHRSCESHRQHLEHRLGLLDHDGGQTRVLRLWRDDGQEATAIVPVDSGLAVWFGKLRLLPQQAGLQMPIQSLLLMILGISLLSFIITYLLIADLIVSIVVVLVWLSLVWISLSARIVRQKSRFEQQLVDAMQLVARSLRVGHPLTGAFHLVAEELDVPISTIFAEVCEQQTLGVSMEEALKKVAEETSSSDFKLFATAVSIQLRTGGNLADMMDRLSHVIRDRTRLSQRVKVLTAQTQFSKRVLLILPVFMYILLSLLNPNYMKPIYETHAGLLMICIAAMSMAIGTLVMNYMAKLRY